jgi:putative endonuclease
MSLTSLTLSLERRAYTALRSLADRKSPQPAHLLLGERGEDAAFFHLRALGYTVVARRWRAARLPGDLDLVAWHADPTSGPTLVVFEIKTRTARDLVPAAASVNATKQQMLRTMTAAYLRQLPEANRDSVPVRYDILSVYLLSTGPEFEHLPDAFPFSDSAAPTWA